MLTFKEFLVEGTMTDAFLKKSEELKKLGPTHGPASFSAHHTKDSDCKVDKDSGLCNQCGAWHDAPCAHCGATAFHKDEHCPGL